MIDVPGRKQMARRLEMFNDPAIGFPDRTAMKPCWNRLVIRTVTLDRTVDVDPLPKACPIVLHTMSRCGMDQPGSILGRDVFRQDDGTGSITEGMSIGQPRQGFTLADGQTFNGFDATDTHDLIKQIFRDHRQATIQLHEDVIEPLMHRDGEIGR